MEVAFPFSIIMVSIVVTGILMTCCSVTAAGHPTVTVEQGTLQGLKLSSVLGKEYFAFLGIPYAKPPVGKLRFRAPREPEPWQGIYNATEDGHECLQRIVLLNQVHGTEDCLFLNVYTPKIPENRGDLRAVMLWIHGGGFKMGTAAHTVYGPDYLLEEDVVIVAIRYRLGILGFLSLPEAGIPGNNGMKDQAMALRWVQKNIAQFGGDPNRVTIFGQSAGGASVHYHLLSPMSKGLFHRAISQSGTALDPWAFNEPEVLRKEAFKFGKKIGCNTTDGVQLYECFLQQPEESLVGELQLREDSSLLRCYAVSIGSLLPTDGRVAVPSTSGSISTGFLGELRSAVSEICAEFTPTRESSRYEEEENFLTEHPKNVISAGKVHNVPYVVGAVAYESAFFLRFINLPQDTDADNCLRNLTGLLAKSPENTKVEELIPKVKNVYYNNNNTATEEGTIDLLTDIMFLCGADQTGRRHAAASSSPVYYYYFIYDGNLALGKQILGLLAPQKGPVHADDVGYLFHTQFTPDLVTGFQDVKMLRRMVKMWTNFAKHGDPTSRMNSELNVKWNHMTKTDNLYLKIDKELSMQRNLQRDRMALCREIMDTY